MMTKLSILFLFVTIVSCEGPPRQQLTIINDNVSDSAFAITASTSDEEYVMVTTASSLPLYVTHDQAAFLAWGKYHNVKVSIVGPSDWDIPGQVEAITQLIFLKFSRR